MREVTKTCIATSGLYLLLPGLGTPGAGVSLLSGDAQ